MGFFKLSHEDAKSSHQSFYDGDFEVMPMERSGFWDVLPLNIILGFIDLPGQGEWGGIISTDGNKVVITESKWSNLAKHKKTFEFDINEIDTLTHNPTGLSIIFKNKIKGLTMAKVNFLIKWLLFICTCGIAVILTSILFKGQLLNISLDDQFENLEKFKSTLNR